VPASVELHSVRSYLSALPGVSDVHDLHVWAMSTSETALTVHLVMFGGHPGDDFLNRVAEALHHDFAIEHTTIQIEVSARECALSHHT
jgi:cobalt-zinc-cadmium efflux system protein